MIITAATASISTPNPASSTSAGTAALASDPASEPAMPRTPKIAPALSWTRPARACAIAPVTAAMPTTRSEAVTARRALCPRR
jgi:hypothetical protein